MYAAKFKLKTTASVKKKGSFFLNKEIGNEKKLALTPFLKISSLIPKIYILNIIIYLKKLIILMGFYGNNNFFIVLL